MVTYADMIYEMLQRYTAYQTQLLTGRMPSGDYVDYTRRYTPVINEKEQDDEEDD